LGPPRLKIFIKNYCIIAALQHNLKGNTMFDLDKQFKEVTTQVKKYNDMWINWTITVLEQLKK
jgi:hypothetical protein